MKRKKLQILSSLDLLSPWQKQIHRKLLKRSWRVYLKILMTVIVMTWKVGMKTLRIGRGAYGGQISPGSTRRIKDLTKGPRAP
jgi:hypothetical protein